VKAPKLEGKEDLGGKKRGNNRMAFFLQERFFRCLAF